MINGLGPCADDSVESKGFVNYGSVIIYREKIDNK